MLLSAPARRPGHWQASLKALAEVERKRACTVALGTLRVVDSEAAGPGSYGPDAGRPRPGLKLGSRRVPQFLVQGPSLPAFSVASKASATLTVALSGTAPESAEPTRAHLSRPLMTLTGPPGGARRARGSFGA